MFCLGGLLPSFSLFQISDPRLARSQAAGVVILVYSLKEREFINNFVPKTCKTISVTGQECMSKIVGTYSQAMITAQSCEVLQSLSTKKKRV